MEIYQVCPYFLCPASLHPFILIPSSLHSSSPSSSFPYSFIPHPFILLPSYSHPFIPTFIPSLSFPHPFILITSSFHYSSLPSLFSSSSYPYMHPLPLHSPRRWEGRDYWHLLFGLVHFLGWNDAPIPSDSLCLVTSASSQTGLRDASLPWCLHSASLPCSLTSNIYIFIQAYESDIVGVWSLLVNWYLNDALRLIGCGLYIQDSVEPLVTKVHQIHCLATIYISTNVSVDLHTELH